MNVLIYAHAFAPNIGGAETFAMTLAQGLSKRSERNARDSGIVAAANEVTVVTQTLAGRFDDAQLGFRVVRRPGIWQLARCIRKADVVQLVGPALFPLFLSKLCRRTTVVEHHGYQVNCPNGLLFYDPDRKVCPGHFMARRYGKCLECNRGLLGLWGSVRLLLLTFARRWLCQRVAANVPISDHVHASIELPRSQRIYYGIEPLEPTAGQEALREAGFVTFAYLGRFVHEKGPILLLHAASLLSATELSFRLKMVGDGPELLNLESLAKQLGMTKRVTFTGYLRGASLQESLADVAALVMPSLMEETFGLSAVEQMLRGRLVIAADIGGLSEVVGDAGLKFKPGDAGELAICLKRVMEQPEIVSQFGERARARALSQFRAERMVEDYCQLYASLLKGESARQP